MQQLQAIKLQAEGDVFYRRGELDKACEKWEAAAVVLDKADLKKAAKALRERMAFFKARKGVNWKK